MKLGKKILSAVVAVMMLLSIAPAASAATYDADYCYSEGYDVAVQIGAEGSVLLKNKDNLLPLAEDTKVTVLGAMSYNYVEGGTGSLAARTTKTPCSCWTRCWKPAWT